MDVWYNDSEKELSGIWTGKTSFWLIHPKPASTHHWSAGRLTRKREGSDKPGNVRTEEWTRLSDQQKKLKKEELINLIAKLKKS